MPLYSTTHRKKSTPRLTAEDWIEEGLSALLEGGIEGVQITAMADALGVTRGSFYWHFKSRGELLDALLAEWRARNSGVITEAVKTTGSLADGVLNLFYVWVDHQRFAPALDQAVRDWARRSDSVKKVVEKEDASRVDAITDLYLQYGFERREAFIRARVIYFTQLSYFSLGIRESLSERMSYLESYYLAFTGEVVDQAIANKFRQRMLEAETKP